MVLAKLLALNVILIFFINIIFCFNRTVYVLLSSLFLFLLTVCVFIFFEFEFIGLIFGMVYVGGIAVMFLFLILTVDVRVENNEKIFVWQQMNFSKLIFSILFSFGFSFLFLWFCDPLLFASIEFYLFINKKIIFAWSFLNEPVFGTSDQHFEILLDSLFDFESLVYSSEDPEIRWLVNTGKLTPFNLEFFLDYFFYNEYIDDAYTLGVLFFYYHYPLLVLVGLFLLVTTIVAVIVCLNIFG